MARISRKSFFFPMQEDVFFANLDDASLRVDDYFSVASQAFKANIQAVISTISLPYQMSAAGVQQRRFQQLHLAEKIRASEHEDKDGNIPEWAEKAAADKARQRLDDELSSPDGINEFAEAVLLDLDHSLVVASFAFAAKELLRQGTVLTWGALEVFARDLFCLLLNRDPKLVFDLLKNSNAKRLFQIKGIEFDILAEYSFDISKNLGDILAQSFDISRLSNIKTIFECLFPNDEELRKILSERDLWILNQRRHLIVHRRGLVDASYTLNTGDSVSVGSELVVSPESIERYLELTRDVGVLLLRNLEVKS